MTRLSTSIVLVALFAVATFFLLPADHFGWAQQASSGMNVPGPGPGAGMSSYGGESDGGYGGGYGYAGEYGEEMYGMEGDGRSAFRSRLTQQTRKLKLAKSKAERTQATKALEQLLGEYFDSDMKRRQAELEQVKQRIARLEALLNKRQAAKQEIVDLQLRTMINESEGLGFFSTPLSSDNRRGYGEYGSSSGMEMMGTYGGGEMMGGAMGGAGMMESDMYEGSEMSSGGMEWAPVAEPEDKAGSSLDPTEVPKN